MANNDGSESVTELGIGGVQQVVIGPAGPAIALPQLSTQDSSGATGSVLHVDQVDRLVPADFDHTVQILIELRLISMLLAAGFGITDDLDALRLQAID